MNQVEVNIRDHVHSSAGVSDLAAVTITGLVTLTGGQIAFPATQVPSADANTLDDYEEGTWTPTFSCVTLGNLNIVYSIQAGFYTKFGQQAIVSFSITTSTFTWTTSSGGARVSGLPFAGQNTANSGSRGALAWGGITKASYTNIVCFIGQIASEVLMTCSGSGQVQANSQIADYPSGGNVFLSSTIPYLT